jgi:hypothetical protein
VKLYGILSRCIEQIEAALEKVLLLIEKAGIDASEKSRIKVIFPCGK